MAEFKFTDEVLEKLLLIPENGYLKNKTPEEKAKEFMGKDPFPYIPDALLNSRDIFKYILTTGMIDPFYPTNLEGATYVCNFSGKYKYWDDKGKERSGDGELKLRPNSIAFLEIEPMLRIPQYLILRFNLKVHHVYKGLLLGTGPIVDPGFVGKLYIPLHNLTSNEYTIKKGTPLICMEFTKLSKYNQRMIDKSEDEEVCWLDFSFIQHTTHTFKPRKLDEYIEKALIGDKNFIKSNSTKKSKLLSIGSSIPEAVSAAEEQANRAEKNTRWFKRIGLVGIVALVIALSALFFTVWDLINSIDSRIDNFNSLHKELLSENNNILREIERLTEENKNLKEQLEALEIQNEGDAHKPSSITSDNENTP